MTLIDLTWDFHGERFAPEIIEEKLPLKSGHTAYTGVIYSLKMDGMSGTYIDFPGHIAETADGMAADNYPLEDVYRVPASVIHLDRKSGSGAVTADDLEKAFGSKISTKALIINALGTFEPTDIENRSVYLDDSAVQWIIDSPCKLLVSDIYESTALHGVFLKLFGAGITTVCMPVNLHKICMPQVKLTVLFPRIPNVCQLPCRAVVEYDL